MRPLRAKLGAAVAAILARVKSWTDTSTVHGVLAALLKIVMHRNIPESCSFCETERGPRDTACTWVL